jgi:copper type II ascorbate-dependent monooxygenase-like protein
MIRCFEWIGLSAMLTLGGCSGGDDDQPVEGLATPAPDEGLQLSMKLTLAPGEEATYCIPLVTPDHPVDIERFEHRYTQGSHHLLLLRGGITAEQAARTDEPFECLSLVPSEVLYGAQVGEGQQELPAGVGMRLSPGEVLVLQTHYLNATADTIDARAAVDLWFREGPATTQAGALFLYDWSISVPARGQASARMHCEIPRDINLISGASHMHRRGVGYEAFLTGGSLDEPRLLYETDRWQDISLDPYDPPLSITAGQAIDFHCDYSNPEDRTIVAGSSAADNEMCVFLGLYYPKMDTAAEACTGPGSGPVMDGDQSCGQVLTCLQSATDNTAAQACLASTCASSSPQLDALVGCQLGPCAEACSGTGDCQSCMMQSCGDAIGNCMAAACD